MDSMDDVLGQRRVNRAKDKGRSIAHLLKCSRAVIAYAIANGNGFTDLMIPPGLGHPVEPVLHKLRYIQCHSKHSKARIDALLKAIGK